MTTTTLLNPDRLAPDELALQLDPFGSWPKDGSLPVGYFSAKRLEGVNKLRHHLKPQIASMLYA